MTNMNSVGIFAFHGGGRKGESLDRTRIAVSRQLSAMGCATYEVGVRPESGGFQATVFQPEQLLAALAWLKHRNACDCHIYIRPACAHTLILLDDLTHESVRVLKKDCLVPAAVVETSPRNFQVWLKLAVPPSDLSHPQATYLAKWFASHYQGDPASADWRHYGRLAGFTNRKPCRRNAAGYYPYVLIREWGGGQIPMTTPSLKQALDSFPVEDTKNLAATRVSHVPTELLPTTRSNSPPAQLYREYMERIFRRSQGRPWVHCPDWSRMDFMIAGDLNRAGYTADEIHSILKTGSPELEKRKAGHVDDYLQRTLAKVKGPGNTVIGKAGPQATSSSSENPRGFYVESQETDGKHED